jgi:hypothetical protein
MTDPGRDELKEQISAMVAGRGDSIDLDTPFHWVIEGLKQPTKFFEHLPQLLPSDSILYVEGTSIVPEVALFYSSHRPHHAVNVVRDRIAPVPDIYHFAFSPDVCAALRQFAERHPVPEMFDHIKAYRGENRQYDSSRSATPSGPRLHRQNCINPPHSQKRKASRIRMLILV